MVKQRREKIETGFKPFSATFLILAVCFIMVFSSSVSAFDWTDSLAAYYKLDNNDFSDELGIYDGSNSGSINTSGIIIDGRSFDGNDLISATSGVAGDTTMTASAWFKTTSTSGYQAIIDLNNDGRANTKGFAIEFYGDNGVIQPLIDGIERGSGTTIVNDGNWHLAVITRNGDTFNVYLDGNSTAEASVTAGGNYGNINMIGQNGHDTINGFFTGQVDEVGIWSRILDSSEITELYNSGSGLPYDISITQIELKNPANNIIISDIGANFTVEFNITGANPNNYTWKNATYYIWKEGVNFNTTTVTLSGNSTSYTQDIDNFILADYEWNVYGCYGNATYNNCTWSLNGNFSLTVGATIDSETYDNETYETAENTFEVNITLLSGVVLQAAYLYYDDVRYIGAVTNLGSDKYSMTKTLSVPSSNGGAENKSFHWSFVYTSPVQKIQNTTSQNQTVSPIFFGLCNATYTIHALDISIKEEGTFDDLNGTLEFSADYWLGDGSVKKQFTFSYLENDTSTYDFCILPTDKTFSVDDIISYTALGYDRRDYFLNDAALSNVTMNLSLYLLSTTATDIFTITVQDQDSKPVDGAFVNVQRWDIGTNNFYTIGMIKTTSDGTGIINSRLNDAWYRYQVIYDEILYLTTEPVKEAGTSRILEINLEEDNPYDQFGEIDFLLTYDEDTNLSVFTYSDTTGAVAIGCLKVLRMEGNGTSEVYYSCVESSSGTLSYKIEGDGTYIIRAIFRLSDAYDNVEQVVDEIIRQGISARFVTIGKFGQFISLMMVGTASMLGVAMGSIPMGLGLIGVSLIVVNLLGWLNISGSVLYGIVSIIILIALNLKRGR